MMTKTIKGPEPGGKAGPGLGSNVPINAPAAREQTKSHSDALTVRGIGAFTDCAT
jgi:hypothetical protein